MRYRIKLTVIVTKDGKTYTFNKYFRCATPRKCYEKQSAYIKELEEDGYELSTEVSVGSWVS